MIAAPLHLLFASLVHLVCAPVPGMVPQAAGDHVDHTGVCVVSPATDEAVAPRAADEAVASGATDEVVALGATDEVVAFGATDQVVTVGATELRAPHVAWPDERIAEALEEVEDFEKDPQPRERAGWPSLAAAPARVASRPTHAEGMAPRVRVVAAHPSRGPPTA